jgi:hypothetical protein
VLEEALRRSSQKIALHEAFSRLLVKENRDAAAIQKALHGLLSLDPTHSWARSTLAAFFRRPSAESAPGIEKPSPVRSVPVLPSGPGEPPNNPWTLFRLGSVYHELGRPAEALPFFQRSLAHLPPGHFLLRKLYGLLVNCYAVIGQIAEAFTTCQEGRRLCPDAMELLFLEAMLRRDRQDLAGAAACLQQLLETTSEAQLASLGLQRYQVRQNLAVIFHQQGNFAGAETHWRAVVAEQPAFLPAWRALGHLYLAQQRWADVEATARQLDATKPGQPEAAALRAQAKRIQPNR